MHLLHPAVVHFSVAFVVAGGLLEAVGYGVSLPGWVRWGNGLVLAGLVSLVPTLATGYLASNNVVAEGPGRDVMDAHEQNGWIVFGLLLVTQFWKLWSGEELSGSRARAYAVAMLVVVAFTLYSALLGGRMVYGHAVGVR